MNIMKTDPCAKNPKSIRTIESIKTLETVVLQVNIYGDFPVETIKRLSVFIVSRFLPPGSEFLNVTEEDEQAGGRQVPT